MNYALDFSVEAKASWGSLGVALQESILDALDRVKTAGRLDGNIFVDDFVVEVAGEPTYVFLELRIVAFSGTLQVHRIGLFARS